MAMAFNLNMSGKLYRFLLFMHCLDHLVHSQKGLCHNTRMHSLRTSKFIARLVLVWFALFWGSAIASTVIKPGSMQIVCSAGGGMKMVDMSGDDGEIKASVSMDCPLCASVTVPPPLLAGHFEKRSPLAHALHPIAAAHMASVTAPPLPSRGPPPSIL